MWSGFTKFLKIDPYHDSQGRFTSVGNQGVGAGVTKVAHGEHHYSVHTDEAGTVTKVVGHYTSKTDPSKVSNYVLHEAATGKAPSALISKVIDKAAAKRAETAALDAKAVKPAEPETEKLQGEVGNFEFHSAKARQDTKAMFGTDDPKQITHMFSKNMPEGVLAKVNLAARDSQLGLVVKFINTKDYSVLGSAVRTFKANVGTVHHDFFELQPDARGNGLASQFLKNSFDVYRKSSALKTVEVDAGLSAGGYVWARFGFKPDSSGWSDLRATLINRMRYKINTSTPGYDEAKSILASDDPSAINRLAAVPGAGKTLLAGTGWSGTINLKDTNQMKMFDDYIASKKKSDPESSNGELDEADALLADLEGPEALSQVQAIAKEKNA